jgi:hypothetical protein
MEWVFLWFMCGMVCASIADKKYEENRSVVIWFSVGCILGVFAVVLVLFMGPSKDAE